MFSLNYKFLNIQIYFLFVSQKIYMFSNNIAFKYIFLLNLIIPPYFWVAPKIHKIFFPFNKARFVASNDVALESLINILFFFFKKISYR